MAHAIEQIGYAPSPHAPALRLRGHAMHLRTWTACVAVALFCVLKSIPGYPDDDDRQPHGQAPLEVLVDGLHDPAGMAIGPDGTLYFTETERGTLQRRTPDGTIRQITNRLDKPRGIVITPDGSLLTLADAWRPQSASKQKGVLIKWSATGVPTVLASGFRNPQQIALSAEEIVVSTRNGVRDVRANARDHDGGDDEDDDDRPPGTVFHMNLAGAIQSAAPRFDSPSGVVIDADRSLTIVAQGASNSRRDAHGNLFRVTPLGELDVLLKDHFDEPAGLVRDALGNLFMAVKSHRENREKGGRIMKIGAGGEPHSFALYFDKPWGLALDAKGNLYVSTEHRIYRFRAPATPVLSSVRYLGQTTVLITGSAELKSLITIRGGATEASAETDANGQFTATVTLQPDRINKLLVYAVGKDGKGLTSPPAVKEVVADFDPPVITVTTQPAPNSKGWNNSDVTVTFNC